MTGVSGPRAVLDAMLIMMGTQVLLFARMFDMQESLDLAPLDRRSLDGRERKGMNENQTARLIGRVAA